MTGKVNGTHTHTHTHTHTVTHAHISDQIFRQYVKQRFDSHKRCHCLLCIVKFRVSGLVGRGWNWRSRLKWCPFPPVDLLLTCSKMEVEPLQSVWTYSTCVLVCEWRASPTTFPHSSTTAAPVSSQLVSIPRTKRRWLSSRLLPVFPRP